MSPSALLLVAAYSFCLTAAQKYLFSFGDSYTDTGFDINGLQPSPDNPLGNPAYASYTFSGSPNYIDFLTVKYNNSLVLSYNFAMGGATISDDVVATTTTSPNIHTFQQQVEQYFQPKYSAPGDEIPPWSADDAIFLIFIGINDIALSYEKDPAATNVPALLGAYFQYVDELHASGARNFLFVGVPPFDRSPPILARGAQNAASCSRYINTYNWQLTQQVQSWGAANPDSKTSIYDFHAWMTQVLDSPQAYGFQDSTCGGDGDSDCIWWGPSDLHTTSHLQNLLSQNMLTSLAVLGW